jgi:O-antigen/teichoic acid export membrane protein
MVIITIGVSKFILGTSDVFHGLFQQNERMDRMAISMIAKGLLTLVALGVGLYLTDSLLWAIIWTIAVLILILFVYEIPNGGIILKTLDKTTENSKKTIKNLHKLLPRWDKKTLIKLGWLLLPLGFVVMLSSLYTNIPRYFIERQLSIAELGIFAAIGSFERAGNFIVIALAQSTSPRLSQYFSAGKRKAFQTLLIKTVGIGVILGIGGVLIAFVGGEQILTFFFQPEYARNDLFILLMIAAGLSYIATFFIHGVTATRAFRVQVLIYSLTTLVLVLACLWLVPRNGLYGAAVAIILGRGAQLISSIMITVNELRKFSYNKTTADSLI